MAKKPSQRGILLHFSGHTLSFAIPSAAEEQKWTEQLQLAMEAIMQGKSYCLGSVNEYWLNLHPFTFVGWEIGTYCIPNYKALQQVVDEHKKQGGGDEPWRQSLMEDDDE